MIWMPSAPLRTSERTSRTPAICEASYCATCRTLLRATVTVPTLDKPVSLKIPPGTRSGRTFRVKGRGVPRKDGTRGDLLVPMEVSVPPRLSADAKAALEAYAKATENDDPRGHLAGTDGTA